MIKAASTAAVAGQPQIEPPIWRRYMPQMDGLRAVAVFPVLYQHAFDPKVPIGSWGVILFFVISGYLISRSLFVLKDNNIAIHEAAWRFFSRRTRRLFPAYYLMLMIFFVFHPQSAWPWYVIYASNFYQSKLDHFTGLTPTWSLAVEEQFYLVWFFVIFLLTQNWLRWILPVLMVTAIVFRGLIAVNGQIMAIYLPPGAFDALAFGSFLCLVERKQQWVIIPSWGGIISVFLIVISGLWIWRLSATEPVGFALCPTLVGLAASYAVWRAREGFSGWIGAFLEWPLIVYLGRISYGIYLYSMVVTHIVFSHVPFIWRSGFAGSVLLTIVIAYLSFNLIERPLLTGKLPPLITRIRKVDHLTPPHSTSSRVIAGRAGAARCSTVRVRSPPS